MTDIDIRIRLWISAVFSVFALIYQEPIILFFLCMINIGVLFLLRIPLKLEGMKTIFYTTFFLMILQSFFIEEGESILVIKGVKIFTTYGFYYGTRMILRFLILFFSGLILYHAKDEELILGLVQLKVPYEIVFMIQVAMRFLPTLYDEMKQTLHAIQLRGVNFKKIYQKRVLKIYVKIFTPMVYSAWSKAEKMSILMELRGFKRYPYRTYYREIHFKKIDYILFIVSIIMMIGWMIFANKFSNTF